MAAPVPLESFIAAPGERFDLVVDFSEHRATESFCAATRSRSCRPRSANPNRPARRQFRAGHAASGAADD